MQSIQTPDPESKARTNAERQRNWRQRQALKRDQKRAAQEALAIAAIQKRIAERRALGLPIEKEEILQRKASGESFDSILRDLQNRLPATVDEVEELEEEVSFETLMSMNRGRYLSKAPSGKGLIVTGGYDSAKIESIVTPEHTDYHINGTRRVKPRGFGPDE